MRYCAHILLGLGLAIHDSSADYARLQTIFRYMPNYLPAESAEQQIFNTNSDAIVFRKSDSVNFMLGSTACVPIEPPPYPCVFVPSISFVRAVDTLFRNLPLQKMTRVFLGPINASPRILYFIVVETRYLMMFTYQAPNTYSTPVLQRVDTIQIPPGRVLGIDTIFQTNTGSPAQFSVRLFGKYGLWGTTPLLPPYRSLPVAYGLANTLDISATGEGFFGTLGGQVLDPARGLGNPIKVADQPILAINRFGALGDSGLVVLRDGGWRQYRIGANRFRVFRNYFYSPKGAYGNLCNNFFTCSDYWLKDDSTQWRSCPTCPAVSSDSLQFSGFGIDSSTFHLYDVEQNFTLPEMTLISPIGGQANLNTSLFGNFIRGCENLHAGVMTCFPVPPSYYRTIPTESIRLAYSQDSLSFRTRFYRGIWSSRAAGYSGGIPVYGAGFPAELIDTVISITWSAGDTLRLKFSNATYTLINTAPVDLSTSNPVIAEFNIRVVGAEIHWAGIHPKPLSWSIRDLGGRPILQGQAKSGSGKIRIPANTGGVRILTFTDPSSRQILWKGRVFIP